MGEFAEMMLDGTLCEGCGVYMGQSFGACRCQDCQSDDRGSKTTQVIGKTACRVCGRRVRLTGIKDHMRDVHGIK